MGKRYVALVTSPVSRSVMCGALVTGIAALAIFVWFVMVAPPVISFSLAAASAVAWCRWMEKDQESGNECSTLKSWAFPRASTPAVLTKENSSS